jgi:hypothetical protein
VFVFEERITFFIEFSVELLTGCCGELLSALLAA